jgi:hypothetical protein
MRDRRGNVLVEFALALPVIVLLLVGVFEYGSATARKMSLTSAARSGVEHALRGGDASAVAETVRRAAGGDAEQLSVTTSQFCECDGAAASCGTACESGSLQQGFMRVRVSEPFTPLLPSFGLPYPTSVAGEATFRLW